MTKLLKVATTHFPDIRFSITLTERKQYDVLSERDGKVLIINDKGQKKWYKRSIFNNVSFPLTDKSWQNKTSEEQPTHTPTEQAVREQAKQISYDVASEDYERAAALAGAEKMAEWLQTSGVREGSGDENTDKLQNK